MWFTNKSKINDLEYRINNLEKEIKQIKCKHTNLNFIKSEYTAYTSDGKIVDTYGHIRCNSCGLVHTTFTNKEDFNSAKVAYLRKQVDELEKK